MIKKYNPKVVEKKWQKIWQEQEVYKADLQSAKPKYIAMSMFNYPSGAGIHIGHAMNYTISDVLARFKRQQGFESYHPVGWDSFGLPAENYAIKSGVSPQESMAKIIPNYHKQYQAMGWSNDWSKEIATHTPEYYKWTQWIFSEMFRAGLAYQDTRLQWWCDKCQTVLANEQIINGKCWRHDSASDPEVVQREVKQWFFKITDYADELLQATDALDWTETVKTAQKNWIGKSVGAEVDFAVEGTELKISVFTTRIDTIFSGAFIVLAPEHPLVGELTTAEQGEVVATYVQESLRKSEMDRQAGKEKTGVFTGSYVLNPANGERIPVWVGDFVLAGYGTGAVFGDIHDERDFEFLKKFNIPARVTVIPEDKEEAQKVLNKEYPYIEEGVLIDSGEFTGMRSEIAREKIVAWLASNGSARERVNYKMRDWSVSRQRYWGAPIPIIYCEKCGPQLVPDADLPVVLPELKDFSPSGDGRSALARATDWLTVACPQCGGEGERETDTLDTYICSSWYFLRYLDSRNSKEPFDKLTANRWMPVDFYNGADHATAHMLYARFVTRFFWKRGLVNNPEPFKKFLFNGKVTAQDGQMFSKSKGNGVDPLEIIPEYGADALRVYLMFAAPLELWIRWDPQGVPAALRFLNRIWSLVQEFVATPESLGENEAITRATHKVAKKVTSDLEDQKYNTAIASMMEFLNTLYAAKAESGFTSPAAWRFALESLVQLVAPFAPHIADELWETLGHTDSIQKDNWPAWDEALVRDEAVTIIVQVNGKMRGKLTLPAGVAEDVVTAAALADDKVQASVGSAQVRKVIFVADKLINIVI